MTFAQRRTAPDDFEAPLLASGGRCLVVRFARPHASLSWAVVNGGRTRAQAVVWRQVLDEELRIDCEPAALLQTSLDEADLAGAVGLLTSRDVARYEDVRRTEGNLSARCVATVGLGNALAVGDTPGPLRGARPGTINLLCQLSRPLSEGALVEAISLAAEARTAAMMDVRIPSRRSLRVATGTGTDCIVIAAPEGPGPERYVGKHTMLGSLLGEAVREATFRGAQAWLRERGWR